MHSNAWLDTGHCLGSTRTLDLMLLHAVENRIKTPNYQPRIVAKRGALPDGCFSEHNKRTQHFGDGSGSASTKRRRKRSLGIRAEVLRDEDIGVGSSETRSWDLSQIRDDSEGDFKSAISFRSYA